MSKDGSVIKNPKGHLMCYQVKPAKDQPKHTPVAGLKVGNEFLQPFSTAGAKLVTSASALDLSLPSPFGLADLNLALVLKAQ